MTRIVIDTDGGIDDALALLFALASPEASVEAITTVHGNVPVEVATSNVREVLDIAGRDVTVAVGCARPLVSEPVFAGHVHGADGLGGWTRTAPGFTMPASESAMETILRLARQFPGEMTLVTIGPLTNAANALRTDPAAFRALKRIVTMGGAVWERGNVTSTAEFNIYADPEAAREVIHGGVPITLVGLDVTHKVEFTRERLDDLLGSRTGLRSGFLRCICEKMFSFYRAHLGRDVFFLHDPLAVAVALDATLVETCALHLDIETKGELTRGMTVPERRPWIRAPANVDVCTNVEADRFLRVFSATANSF